MSRTVYGYVYGYVYRQSVDDEGNAVRDKVRNVCTSGKWGRVPPVRQQGQHLYSFDVVALLCIRCRLDPNLEFVRSRVQTYKYANSRRTIVFSELYLTHLVLHLNEILLYDMSELVR